MVKKLDAIKFYEIAESSNTVGHQILERRPLKVRITALYVLIIWQLRVFNYKIFIVSTILPKKEPTDIVNQGSFTYTPTGVPLHSKESH